MKILSALLLFATACGSDYTTLEVTCAETSPTQPEREDSFESTGPDVSARRMATGPRPVPSDSPPVSAPPPPEVVHPIVLSPSSELLGAVRLAAQRFTERLEIPVVVGEGGIPITVQPTVLYKGKLYSAIAHYSRPCVFSGCNAVASIVIAEEMLTIKRYNLDQILDHEIGHILSAWGRVAGVSMHLQDGHVMSSATLLGIEWTQEDIDFWCSASPCGRTVLGKEWTYPVPPPQVDSDGGTSYLSDGVDAGGNVGWLPDAGLRD